MPVHAVMSHVTYSARDVLARVVRPQGVGIAASRDAARDAARTRCRSRDHVVAVVGASHRARWDERRVGDG